jgi:hypothetical protein
MATTIATTFAASVLSPALKDLYEQSKGSFGNTLSKWNNSKAIHELAKKVSAYEKIKTIWQREKEVKLSSFYYPSKVLIDENAAKTVSSLKDLPTSSSLVIQGTVGQGKSVFLRYLCLQELKTNSSGRIPVFLELRKIDDKFDLKAAVYSTLKNLGFEISDTLFKYYAESGKLVLLLDGFDELNEDVSSNTIVQLESWAVEHPTLQIIVTSRPGADIQKSNYFHVIRLAPLSANDHKSFMTRIGVKGETLENLLRAIVDSPVEIRNLLTTPLLLTLLVLVYQVEHSVPSELPEFFKLLFVTVFSRHDGTKPAFKRPHKSGLNERKLELLFESFCFAVKRRRLKISLTEDEFNTVFEDASRFFKEKCEVEGFRHDVIKIACLMQEDGLMLSFVHKSLLDYFSAAFISSRTDNQAQQIYTSVQAVTREWRPTLQFLQHIDKYRYSRYFAIPRIKADLAFLRGNDSENAIEEEQYEKLFNAVIKDATIQFAALEGKELQNAGFGPYYDPDFYFCDLLVGNTFYLYDHTITYKDEAELVKIHPETTTAMAGEQLQYKVPYTKFVTNKAKDKFKERVDAQYVQLRTLLKEFEDIVAYEDANANLLASFDVFSSND